MSTDRIKQLQQFLEDDPGDPFNVYALAIEYWKFEPAKTRELFDRLLREHPDYLPTYYHAAKLCQDFGENEKAIRIYETGIALASRLNDAKALRELRSARDELMFE